MGQEMIPLDHLFDYYSKRHYEFQLGWGIVGQVSALITFETFAMVFCAKFNITGTPALFLYAGAPIVSVLLVTFLGHKMIHSGYASKYQQYGWNVNEDWVEMKEHIKCIRVLMEGKDDRITGKD